MLRHLISTLSLFGAVAYGFQDTSPFFAFISSSNPTIHLTSTSQAPIAQSTDITASLAGVLERCPTEVYVFVSQPSVTAQDFISKNSAPHLRRQLTTANETSSWRMTYPEVVGNVDLPMLQKIVTEKCGAVTINVDQANGIITSSSAFPQMLNLQFPTLSTDAEKRASELLSHDSFLNTILQNLTPRPYTVLYTTTPLSHLSHAESLTHDLATSFKSALHTDLKRDLDSQVIRQKRQSNGTDSGMMENAPLFETYAFLNPAIFMGGIAVLILFPILYAAVLAVASVEIPHAAFSREMGPAAQRKQQ